MPRDLDSEIQLYVPQRRATNALLRDFAVLAGGYTVVPARGGWVMGKDNKLFQEGIDIVSVMFDSADHRTAFKLNAAALREVQRLHSVGEEAVLMVQSAAGSRKARLYFKGDLK